MYQNDIVAHPVDSYERDMVKGDTYSICIGIVGTSLLIILERRAVIKEGGKNE